MSMKKENRDQRSNKIENRINQIGLLINKAGFFFKNFKKKTRKGINFSSS